MNTLKSKIGKLVQQEEYVFIILDACRYDTFKATYNDYLNGDLKKAVAPGYETLHYSNKILSDNNIDLSDTFFINSNPHMYNKTDLELLFKEVINVWDFTWDNNVGTTRPESITDVSISLLSEIDTKKIFIHYLQPHTPYIGTTGLSEYNYTKHNITDVEESYDKDIRPNNIVYNLIKDGKVNDNELRKAYISNLKYVLKEVNRLIQYLDCKIIISADHGENLGENNNYLHRTETKYTREVPWLEVDINETAKTITQSDIIDVPREEPTSSEEEINQRLRDLGYLDQ